MITAIDFSEYELNRKYYGGSERKERIFIDVGESTLDHVCFLIWWMKLRCRQLWSQKMRRIRESISSLHPR